MTLTLKARFNISMGTCWLGWLVITDGISHGALDAAVFAIVTVVIWKFTI